MEWVSKSLLLSCNCVRMLYLNLTLRHVHEKLEFCLNYSCSLHYIHARAVTVSFYSFNAVCFLLHVTVTKVANSWVIDLKKKTLMCSWLLLGREVHSNKEGRGLKETGNATDTKSLRLDSPTIDGTSAHSCIHMCSLWMFIYKPYAASYGLLLIQWKDFAHWIDEFSYTRSVSKHMLHPCHTIRCFGFSIFTAFIMYLYSVYLGA